MNPLLAAGRAAESGCKHRVCEIDQYHFTLVQRRGKEGKRDERKKLESWSNWELSLFILLLYAPRAHTHTHRHAHFHNDQEIKIQQQH